MSPKRRDLLKMLSGGALASTVQTGSRADDTARPNILVIMADQNRVGLTRANGFPLDMMPELDRVASRGVSFANAYTTAPLCVPARISMLTEVLTRIPMVWSGWNIQPQTRNAAFVSTADVLPTLCEAMGAPIPAGAQGRSLWPMLQGKEYPREEFETIYSEVGFRGMDYGPQDEINPRWGRVAGKADALPTYDELNPVTQSGSMKMVRRGDWKLTFDMMGTGQIFNLARDPYELNNLYGHPEASQVQPQLMADLLRWTIRTQDDLPVGAYQPKWPEHNWYSPYESKDPM